MILEQVRMNYCCSLEIFRDLFHKVLLKQILRPLRTLLSQQVLLTT